VAQPVHADGAADACACHSALQYAILTSPEARDPAMLDKLSAVAGRMLKTTESGE
jgi:5'-methylthioadenosine phosphorylase